MAEAATSEVVSRGKRAEKTKRLFLNAAGDASPRARLDSVAGKVVFVETNEALDFNWNDLSPEVQRAAGLYGIMTSVTNTVGRADMSIDDMIEAATDRLSIILDGNWSAEAKSGPGNNDLLLALQRTVEGMGKTWDPAPYLAKLADENVAEEFKKKWQATPQVKAHLDAIKSERALARLKKSQEAAAASGADVDLL